MRRRIRRSPDRSSSSRPPSLRDRANRVLILALSFATIFGTIPVPVLALPSGQQVAHGSASFDQSGSRMDITTSDRVIINYKDFSISSGELVHFHQPSADSTALNRVTGSNLSEIMGTLRANGNIILLNPHGILFGRDAVINVHSLVASTLSITDADFLAGILHFQGDDGGSVINLGRITADLGGRIFLLAPDVRNEGTLEAPQGQVGLIGAREVFLTDDIDGHVAVRVQVPEGEAVNTGRILAEAGRVGIYAKAVKQLGVVEANALSQSQFGTVEFLGSESATLAEGAQVLARGGKVLIETDGSASLESGSLIDVSASELAPLAGEIAVRSSGLEVYGQLLAKGGGGAIDVSAGTGTAWIAGLLDASASESAIRNPQSAIGGSVHVLGDHVGLIESARIDASGASGGGTILIGGDYQGANPDIQNASRAYVGPDVSLTADATDRGDGGKVIIWSDEVTKVHGTITARGGPQGGDGGLIETSGKDYLEVVGARVDASATQGAGGMWLLDPYNVSIEAASTVNVTPGPPNFDANATGSIVSNVDIQNALNTGSDVNITTGAAGGEEGDITVNASITMTGGTDRTLALRAAEDILFINGSDINATNAKLNVILNSDRDGNGTGGIRLEAGTVIRSNNGNITLGGGADPLTTAATGTGDTANVGVQLISANLVAGTGDVSLRGDGTVNGVYLSDLAISGGNVTLVGVINGDSTGIYMARTEITTGSGDIDITGVGNATTGSVGIKLDGNASVDTVLRTASGSISLNGTGGGRAVDGKYGVDITSYAEVDGGASGNVTIVAKGGGSSNTDNLGLKLAGSINVTAGTVNITAEGGNGTSAGVALTSGGNILSKGAGPIIINGTGSDSGAGIKMDSATSEIGGGAATGAITLVTDSLDITAGTINTTGTLTIRPKTTLTEINIGDGVNVGTGALNLTDTAVGTFGDSITTVTIGRSDGTGDVAVNTLDVSGENYNLNLYGGNVDFDGMLNVTGRTAQIHSKGNITSSAATAVTASSLALNAGTGIGGSSFNTSVTTLAAQTMTSGNIYIEEADSVTIGTVGGVTGINTSAHGGDINLSAGDLVLSQAINAGVGDIVLRPDDATDTIGINTSTATDFNLTATELTDKLHSSGTVTIGRSDGSGDINVSTTDLSAEAYLLKISAGAGSDVVISGNLTAPAKGLTIDPPDTVSVNAAVHSAGPITIEATDLIDLNAVLNTTTSTTQAAITLTAANIHLGDDLLTEGGAVTASGNAILTAAVTIDTDLNDSGTAGAINFADSMLSANALGWTLTLNATGGTDGDIFLKGADTVGGQQLSNITIVDAKDVTFGPSNLSLNNTLLQQASSGTTTFNGAVTASTVNITAGDDITVNSSITVSSSTISLNAGVNFHLEDAGSLNVASGTGDLTVIGGAYVYLKGNSSVTHSGTGEIAIAAGAEDLWVGQDAAANVTIRHSAGNISLTGGPGSGDWLRVIGNSSVSVGGNGSINATAGDMVTLNDNSAVTVGGSGNIDLWSSDGALQIGLAAQSSNATVRGVGDGDIRLAAGSSSDSIIMYRDSSVSIGGNGSINATASGSIALYDNSMVTVGGSGNIDLSSGSGFIMGNSTSSNATVRVVGDGDIRLAAGASSLYMYHNSSVSVGGSGSINATASTSMNLWVNSTVTVGGSGNIDLSASNDDMNIGSSSASNVTVRVVGDGDIRLTSGSGNDDYINTYGNSSVSIGGNGSINATAGDDIYVRDNSSVTVGGSGNIDLSSSADDLYVGDDSSSNATVRVVDDGDIRLAAGSGVLDYLFIKGNSSVSVGGNGSINGTAAWGVSVDDNSAVTVGGSGNIDLSSSDDDLYVGDDSSSNATVRVVGDGDIRLAAGSGSGDILLIFGNSSVSVGGNGSINATAGDYMGLYGNSTVTVDGSGNIDLSALTTDIHVGGSLSDNATIRVVGDGDIRLIAADDIFVRGNSSVEHTGNGTVSVTADSDGSGAGEFEMQHAGTLVSVANNALTITASDITLTGSIDTGTGNMSFIPSNTNIEINLGNGAAGAFDLNSTEMGNLNSTGTVTIGQSGGSADISINAMDLSAEKYLLKVTAGAGSDVVVAGTLVAPLLGLTIDPPDTVSVNAAVHSAGPITIEATDLIDLNAVLNTTTGTTEAISLTAANIHLGADVLTEGGAVTASGNAILTASVTVDTDLNDSGTAGAINFADSMLSANALGWTLTLNATGGTDGDIFLKGADTVGGQQLSNITIVDARNVEFGPSNLSLNNTLLQQTSSGTTTFEGAVTASTVNLTAGDGSSDDITVNNSITVIGGVIYLNATAGDFNLENAGSLNVASGAGDLTVIGGQYVYLNGNSSITHNGTGEISITTKGTRLYIGENDQANVTIRHTAGNISFNAGNISLNVGAALYVRGNSSVSIVGNGSIDATAASVYTVDDAVVSVGGNGSINLAAIGVVELRDNSSVVVDGSGNIDLSSKLYDLRVGNSGANALVQVGGDGDIRLAAGATSDDLYVSANSSVVVVGDGSINATTSRHLYVVDTGSVMVNGSGNIDLTSSSGELYVGSLSSHNATVRVGRDGDIRLAAGDSDSLRVFGDSSVSVVGNGSINATATISLSVWHNSSVLVGGSGNIDLSGRSVSIGSGSSSNATVRHAGTGEIRLKATADIGIQGNASVEHTGNGTVSLTADSEGDGSGEFEMQHAGTLISVANNALTITAADVLLTAGNIETGTGAMTLRPSRTDTEINLGDGAAGAFDLNTTELGHLNSTGTVTIGQSTGTADLNINATGLGSESYNLTLYGGNVDFDGELKLRDAGTLQVHSGGNILAGEAGDEIVIAGGSVALNATGDIGKTGLNGPIDVKLGAGVLAANSTTSGDIYINSNGTLTVGSVAAAGISGISTNGSDIEITGSGTLTVNEDINADSDGNVTIDLTGGDVSINAGVMSSDAGIGDGDGTIAITAQAGKITTTATGKITATGAGGAAALNARDNLGTSGQALLTNVTTLAAQTTGAGNGLFITEDNALNVGTVGALTGLQTDDGQIVVSTVNGTLTIQNTATARDVSAGNNTINLTAGTPAQAGTARFLTIETGARVVANGTITLKANAMNLSQMTASAGLIDAGTASVDILPFLNDTIVHLGGDSVDVDGNPDLLGINSTEQSNINGSAINYGDPDSTADYIIKGTVTAPGGGDTVSITTNGNIVDDNPNGDDIVAPNTIIQAAGSIGNSTDALDTNVTFMDLESGGNVFIVNNGTLTLQDLDSDGYGLNATLGSEGVIIATSPLTINSTTLVNGTFTFQANGTAGPGDNLTIAADVTGTDGGTLIFRAGDDILHTNGTINSTVGTVNKVVFTADLEGDSSGRITQSGGTLLAANVAFESYGDVSYTQTANNISTLAANVTQAGASFNYVDLNDFSIGSVNGVDGITTNNGPITLKATDLDIDEQLNAGTHNISIVRVNAGNFVLGDGTGDMTLAGAELQRVTANRLVLGGTTNVSGIIVNNLAAANTGNLSTLVLDARVDGSAVDFLNNPSTLGANVNLEIDVTNGGVNISQALTLSGTGGADIDATGNNVIIGGVLTAGSGGVDVAEPDQILVNGAVHANGTVSLNATSLIDLDAQVNTSVGAANDVLFTVGSAGNINLGANVLTNAGNISFAGNVIADADVDLSTGIGEGNITFQYRLDGATSFTNNLTLTAGTGNVDFDGTVGVTRDLGDLAIVSAEDVTADAELRAQSIVQAAGSGTTTLSANVSTNGTAGLNISATAISLGMAEIKADDGLVRMNGATTITEDLTINSTGGAADANDGDVVFANTLNAEGPATAENLTLIGGQGNLSFVGAVGGARRLDDLTINTAQDTRFSSTLNLTGDLTQLNGTGTTRFDGQSTAALVDLTTTSVDVNAPMSTAGANGNITFTTDNIDLVGPGAGNIDAGSGLITIEDNSAGRTITLGAESAGTLSLTDTEMDALKTSSRVILGSQTAGDINSNGSVTLASGTVDTLQLITDSDVTNNGAGSIGVTNLSIDADNEIGSQANPINTSVSRIEAVSTVSGDIFIDNKIAANITDFAFTTFAGLNTTASNISYVNDGTLTLNANITANSDGDIYVDINSNGALNLNDYNITSINDGTIVIEVEGAVNPGAGGGGTIGATGGSLAITSNTTIGSAAAFVQTDVGNLAANLISPSAAVNGIYLLEADSVNITTVAIPAFAGGGSVSGISTQTGDAPIQLNITAAGSTLNISQAISAHGDGSVTLTMDGLTSNITSGGGAGNISSGSGDITLTSTQAITLGDSVQTTNGFVNMTTGTGNTGLLTLTAAGGSISSGGGEILLNVDDLEIDNASATAISSGAGRITIRPADQVDGARPISLGTDSAGSLGIDTNEFDRITNTGVVQIGDTFAGNVVLNADVAPDYFTTLRIQSFGNISTTDEAHTITAGNLAIEVNREIGAVATGRAIGVNVDTIALNSILSGDIGVHERDGHTIGTVDGLSGITTNASDIEDISAGTITIGATVFAGGDGDILIQTTAGSIEVNADVVDEGNNNDMALRVFLWIPPTSCVHRTAG